MFYNFKLLMSIYILNILLSTSVGEICLVFAGNLGLSTPLAVGLHLIQFQTDLSLLLFPGSSSGHRQIQGGREHLDAYTS